MFDYNDIINPVMMNWVIIPVLICLARIVDVSIGTIRIIFVSKGMKYLAPALGFFEVLIWLLAIGQIMQNLSNPLNYIAYATGFALGNYVGILLENRIAMGIVLIRVITKVEASDLINHLRERGLTVTSIDAEGNQGDVKVFFTISKRKNLKAIINTISEFNPHAFYTIEDIGFVQEGILPSSRHRRKILEMITWKRR